MKRIPRSRACRLSFLFVAVLLTVGMALGALPAAAASASAPYKAEFYADGVLVATVPFDPAEGISAEIIVPKKDGYIGAWEPYTLAAKNMQVHAVYTPIEGYQPPIDDVTVILCLLVLIAILLVAILLLVILTLRARKILRANGLWGKGKKEKENTSSKEKNTSDSRKAADTAAESVEKEKAPEKGKETPSKTEEATATGKKSNASVADKAENEEADSGRTPAEASEQQATASAPATASTASDAGKTDKDEDKKNSPDQKHRSFIPVPLVVNNGDKDEENEENTEQKASSKPGASAFSSEKADGREEEMSTVLVGKDGRRVQVKYRQSFRARIIGACEESKSYYNELKNYLLSFGDVNVADSLNYESFSSGRSQLAKMNISGKTVMLFLALDPAKLEGTKYKYEDVGNRKRYEKTPVKIKVRSTRSAKWAKELIDMAMAENGRPFVALRNEKYVPDEAMSREEMIRGGLIRVDARDMETGEKVDEATVIRMIEEGAVGESAAPKTEQAAKPAAVAIAAAAAEREEDAAEDEELLEEGFTLSDMRMMANVELAPDDDFIPHMEEVTPEEAEELVENIVAIHHIEHHASPKASAGKKRRGKPAVINIDALDQRYAAGETVTLARLKADGLVAKKARSLKILASGKLTKSLTVEANRFSLTAVKMILLTGGTPVLLD